MKKGRGKAKGSAFERDVCKQLSLWVSKGKHKDLFWRSSMSGGRATVHRKKGANVRQAGDITAVTPAGHALTDAWYIECKHYKSIDLPQFILHGRGRLVKWWTRAKAEARQYGKAPVLIVKQNGWPTLLLCRVSARMAAMPAAIVAFDDTHQCNIHILKNALEAYPWRP